MADRVAVLSQGRLEQFAPPTEVYDTPGYLFVNTFVGTANVLPGTLVDGRWQPTRRAARRRRGDRRAATGRRRSLPAAGCVVCIRPEHLRLAERRAGGIAGVGRDGPAARRHHRARGPHAGGGTAIKLSEPRIDGRRPRRWRPARRCALRPVGRRVTVFAASAESVS